MHAASRLAGLATLMLAALPALAVATAAHAAPVTVKISDLDLHTPAGVAEMNRRIDAAAKAFCAQRADTGSHLISRSCRQAVREELLEQLNTRGDEAR
jgi:UrcA family protein